jgi:predicted transcriptional regulator
MPRRPAAMPLTDAELRIMHVLWARGECTTMDVVNAITRPKLARNTVMTTLGVLERKGYVRHRVDGRTFIFRAAVARDAARKTVLENVLERFFDGSAEQLVSKLLDGNHISEKDRKRIQKLLDEAPGE